MNNQYLVYPTLGQRLLFWGWFTIEDGKVQLSLTEVDLEYSVWLKHGQCIFSIDDNASIQASVRLIYKWFNGVCASL